ncbi:MAG TPA: MDR family oxidoreductase [Bryobacteraceae bacterium]|jgi:acrylyl-CoA reductase (NADPH)|nr:MDR family oxidoreductase [Bryobacteraceae bacterium]
MPTFRALLLESADGQVTRAFRDLEKDALPRGEVLIRVSHSSLNYKDGLAVAGKPGVVRKYPMVPGVDLAGTVEESSAPEFKPGDPVVVTGCGTSETLWGGYAQYCRLDAKNIVHLPDGITREEAMAVGTAGFTAMQCVMALEQHGLSSDREVLVTGASGGVGSIAIAILSRLGYKVAAATGRLHESDYLRSLGASEVIDRATLGNPGKPLESERWGGAVDSVGGAVLAGVIRSVAAGCSIAACGLAGGPKLETTVFPFILRGVNLLGIDSVHVHKPERERIWSRLRTDLPKESLHTSMSLRPLSEVFELADQILKGETRGRIVLDVDR